MEFYKLTPESSGILQCKNQQLCSLVMISMPDYLVSLFKGCVTGQQQPSTSSGSETGISPGVSSELNERGPLSYIAGYVLSNLRNKSVQKKNDKLQTILQSMICPDVENSYIESRSRSGLVTPSQDLCGY
jgi:hypothetical protein